MTVTKSSSEYVITYGIRDVCLFGYVCHSDDSWASRRPLRYSYEDPRKQIELRLV